MSVKRFPLVYLEKRKSGLLVAIVSTNRCNNRARESYHAVDGDIIHCFILFTCRGSDG